MLEAKDVLKINRSILGCIWQMHPKVYKDNFRLIQAFADEKDFLLITSPRYPVAAYFETEVKFDINLQKLVSCTSCKFVPRSDKYLPKEFPTSSAYAVFSADSRIVIRREDFKNVFWPSLVCIQLKSEDFPGDAF